MAVPSRPFGCCGTNRSWLRGIAIFFIVIGAVFMLTLVVLLRLGFTGREMVAGAIKAESPNPNRSAADIALVVLVALELLTQITCCVLPLVAEDKNKPRLLVYFRIYLYVSLVFGTLFTVFTMIAGIKGIPLGVLETLFTLTFICILVVVTNRRFEELTQNSENAANEGRAPQSVQYKIQGV